MDHSYARPVSLLLLLAGPLACGASSDEIGGRGGGTTGGNGGVAAGGNGGNGTGGTGGSGGSGAMPPIITTDAAPRDVDTRDGGLCGTTLVGTVRDLQDSHPDFEKFTNISDKQIVDPVLGTDQKPVYAGNPLTPSTTGKQNFDAWYHDVAAVNVALPVSIQLVADDAGGTYTFNNDAFFPIDGQGFGNQGRNHNFHFTAEIHTRFIYRGAEVFTFKGDDDIFVFINNRLVINLGGVHTQQTEQVSLDVRAVELGLVRGGIYALDLFFAERHTVESHIRIDTTIGSFVDCGRPPPPK